MKILDIIKGSDYSLSLFTEEQKLRLDNRIFEKENKKGISELFVKCIVRDRGIRLTPEEVVRQLYAERLMDYYNYPKERLAFEYPIYFGREAKRADIVIRDQSDFSVAYIIIEIKKPKAKDGREQLKSYTHGTGASMAVWTNGDLIIFHI